jgi:hypothetical protein
MVVVVALVFALAGIAVPSLAAYSREVHLIGAGRKFLGEFRLARSAAIRSGVHTAIRFETTAEGTFVSVYVDGNHNGVLSHDITAGRDQRIAGPRRLDGGAPDVRVGIISGTPAIPPDRGLLDPADPIQFGRSNMLSFSPLGTSTPGTFYLAGRHAQAAVRVNGGTSRARLMVCRGGRWVER